MIGEIPPGGADPLNPFCRSPAGGDRQNIPQQIQTNQLLPPAPHARPMLRDVSRSGSNRYRVWDPEAEGERLDLQGFRQVNLGILVGGLHVDPGFFLWPHRPRSTLVAHNFLHQYSPIGKVIQMAGGGPSAGDKDSHPHHLLATIRQDKVSIPAGVPGPILHPNDTPRHELPAVPSIEETLFIAAKLPHQQATRRRLQQPWRDVRPLQQKVMHLVGLQKSPQVQNIRISTTRAVKGERLDNLVQGQRRKGL